MEASVADATPEEQPEGDDRRSIDDLQTRLTEVVGRQKQIDGEFAGRALPEKEKAEFESLQTEKQDLVRTIEELETRTAWITESAEKPKSREPGAQFYAQPQRVKGDDIHDLSTIRMAENPLGELRDRAKTCVERMQFHQLGTWGDTRDSINREDAQTNIERLIEKHDRPTDDGILGGGSGETLSRRILVTMSESYRKAFWKSVAAAPQPAHLTSEEQRALALGSPPGAGSAVPVTLDPTIIPTSNSSVNPVRAISRKETLVGSNTWNGVSSGAITAARVAEATAGSDNTPTIAAPSATVTKAWAFVPFSHEAGEDWGALESEMGRLFQDAKDDEEATAFVTGAGTTVNPQGFVTGATSNNVAAASGLTVTAANVYALEAALPPRFRPRETFVANRGIYNVIRGIDTAGGAALWLYISQGLNNQAPTPGNTGATLLNAPAYEATAMQASVVNATKIMVVGDFNYFLVLDRIGMQVEFIPNLFSGIQPTGQRGILAYWRNTSKTLSANAFATLTGTT